MIWTIKDSEDVLGLIKFMKIFNLGQYFSMASFNVYLSRKLLFDISCMRNPMNAWHGTPVI